MKERKKHIQQNEFSSETDISSDIYMYMLNSSFNEKSYNLNTQISVFEAIQKLLDKACRNLSNYHFN